MCDTGHSPLANVWKCLYKYGHHLPMTPVCNFTLACHATMCSVTLKCHVTSMCYVTSVCHVTLSYHVPKLFITITSTSAIGLGGGEDYN
jgi:hypothetical protein